MPSAILLAQSALAGYSLVQLAVLVIVIAAVCGIVFVVLRRMGVAVPQFIIEILWIIFAAVIGIAAIYFLFSMIGRM